MEMVAVHHFYLVVLFLGYGYIAVSVAEEFFYRPGPSLKKWRLNTNFDNPANWQGLAGHENCTKNIYTFPPMYDQELVVTLPKVFTGKQIILPVNGHFVFQEGVTKFLSSSAGGGNNEALEDDDNTCGGREVNFIRASQADWFDPDKWARADLEHKDGSLLNAKSSSLSSSLPPPSSHPAIAHVERVPCQYDAVRFPANSSFNLKISSNVTIAKFYLGDKVQSYTDVAILMNSPLGKLQFRKDSPETIFSITDNKNNNNGNSNNNKQNKQEAGDTNSNGGGGGGEDSFCHDHPKFEDTDSCICSNYLNRETRKKICSLAICEEISGIEEKCPNPITPHGFCCPICGFHLKIRHTGALHLIPLFRKLKAEVGRRNLQGKVHAHLAHYNRRAAHLVLVPRDGNDDTSAETSSGEALVQIAALVSGIESTVKQEEEVIEVTVIESWGRVYPSGGSSSDRLAGSSFGAGVITLFVFLGLLLLLAGIAVAIFMWNKKNGYPPLSLSSVTSSLPRMPSIRIPIVPPGRRSSTLSNSLQSFGFARFTNERVSTVTIGTTDNRAGQEGGSSGGKLPKSSSIRRAEEVDAEVTEKVTDAKSGAYGFSNVSYDLVAGVGEGGSQAAGAKGGVDAVDQGTNFNDGDRPLRSEVTVPVLQLPEIIIKEEDNDVTSPTPKGVKEVAPKSENLPSSILSKSKSKKREEGKGGGTKLPGFVATRLAKAYQKLGPDEGAHGDEGEVQQPIGGGGGDDVQGRSEGEGRKDESTSAASTSQPVQEVQETGVVREQILGDVETLVNLEE